METRKGAATPEFVHDPSRKSVPSFGSMALDYGRAVGAAASRSRWDEEE